MIPMMMFAVLWAACSVAGMALLNIRIPFGKWWWPDHEPFEAWLMAAFGGPFFLLTVAMMA